MSGFLVDNGVYAAIEFGNQLMILHQGKQIKVCKTEESARRFIKSHKKSTSSAELPI